MFGCAFAWLGSTALGGCDESNTDESTHGDTGGAASPGESSGDAKGDASGGPIDGEQAECDVALGAGACAELDVCDAFDCGGKTAPFNHFCCPRVPCTADAACEEGERCFPVALDTACRSAATCTAAGDACECSTGELACAGTNEAHCLPVGFYPASGDCEVEALACEELAAQADAVETARQFHDTAGAAELVDALATCATRIAAAQQDCPASGVR